MPLLVGEQVVPVNGLRIVPIFDLQPRCRAAVSAVGACCPLPDDPSRSRSQAARNRRRFGRIDA